jgi:hypothetical protein
MTITLSLPFLLLAGFSLLLFIGVTILGHYQGMFDGGDGYAGGLGGLFLIILYAILWAGPSLLAWAIWATWWK